MHEALKFDILRVNIETRQSKYNAHEENRNKREMQIGAGDQIYAGN